MQQVAEVYEPWDSFPCVLVEPDHTLQGVEFLAVDLIRIYVFFCELRDRLFEDIEII